MLAEFWAAIFEGTIDPGDNPLEPAADILYPVIDRLDKIQLFTDDDDHNKPTAEDTDIEGKVVAVLSSGFYWRDTIKNVLPNNRKGLVVVFTNPCSSSFTYLVK
jgi:hypothetical protein